MFPFCDAMVAARLTLYVFAIGSIPCTPLHAQGPFPRLCEKRDQLQPTRIHVRACSCVRTLLRRDRAVRGPVRGRRDQGCAALVPRLPLLRPCHRAAPAPAPAPVPARPAGPAGLAGSRQAPGRGRRRGGGGLARKQARRTAAVVDPAVVHRPVPAPEHVIRVAPSIRVSLCVSESVGMSDAVAALQGA